MEKSLEEYQKKQVNFLSTKDNIARLQQTTKDDIVQLQEDTKDSIMKLRVEVKEDINKVRNELANAKAEIIKGMFIFLVGQGISIIGILKFIK